MCFFLADISNMHKCNCSKCFDKVSSFSSYLIFECINEHNECGDHKSIMEAEST